MKTRINHIAAKLKICTGTTTSGEVFFSMKDFVSQIEQDEIQFCAEIPSWMVSCESDPKNTSLILRIKICHFEHATTEDRLILFETREVRLLIAPNAISVTVDLPKGSGEASAISHGFMIAKDAPSDEVPVLIICPGDKIFRVRPQIYLALTQALLWLAKDDMSANPFSLMAVAGANKLRV